QTVMRPSIESDRMAAPRNSITLPMPPPVPMRPMTASTTSLAVTPSGNAPSTVTAIVPGRRWGSVWVARTCSTSLVPMPKASAPPRQPEPVERLRRGDLVDEVEVDVQDVGLALGPTDDVRVPDLLTERSGLGHRLSHILRR